MLRRSRRSHSEFDLEEKMMEQEERTLEEWSRTGTESETQEQIPEDCTQISQTETE